MRLRLKVFYTEKYGDILGSNLALELSDSNLDGNEQVQWFHYTISPQMRQSY